MILDSLQNISWKLYTKWKNSFSSAHYHHMNWKLNNDLELSVWAENKVWVYHIECSVIKKTKNFYGTLMIT